MKPTLAMETKCNISDSSAIQRQEHVQACARSKWVTGAIVAIVSLGIISGIVVGAVQLGAHLTSTAHKESWVSYNTVDGHRARERLSVGDDEEVVYIPGQCQALFDFKRSIFLLKDLSDNRGICLLTTFNRTTIPSPAELRPLMSDGEIQSDVDLPATTFHMTPTSSVVSTDVLSATSQSMCKTVYWARPSEGCQEGHLREKRRIRWKVTINLLIFKIELEGGRR